MKTIIVCLTLLALAAPIVHTPRAHGALAVGAASVGLVPHVIIFGMFGGAVLLAGVANSTNAHPPKDNVYTLLLGMFLLDEPTHGTASLAPISPLLAARGNLSGEEIEAYNLELPALNAFFQTTQQEAAGLELEAVARLSHERWDETRHEFSPATQSALEKISALLAQDSSGNN